MARPIGISDDEWVAKKRALNQAYYAANREKFFAKNQAYRESNREKKRDLNREYYLTNRELLLHKLRQKREQLDARYVAKTLCITVSKCPEKLIEIKREQLMIYRSVGQLIQTIKENQND